MEQQVRAFCAKWAMSFGVLMEYASKGQAPHKLLFPCDEAWTEFKSIVGA